MESCQELVDSSSASAAGLYASAAGAQAAAALRAQLARCDLHDGHAFLHVEEVFLIYRYRPIPTVLQCDFNDIIIYMLSDA